MLLLLLLPVTLNQAGEAMDSTKATANENSQEAQHRAGEMMDSAKANTQVGLCVEIFNFF